MERKPKEINLKDMHKSPLLHSIVNLAVRKTFIDSIIREIFLIYRTFFAVYLFLIQKKEKVSLFFWRNTLVN